MRHSRVESLNPVLKRVSNYGQEVLRMSGVQSSKQVLLQAPDAIS